MGAQWVDLDGEGLPGALVASPGAWWYRRPEGEGRLGAPRALGRTPAFRGVADGRHQLVDFDGDGQLDLVHYAPPMSGFFAQTGTYGGAGRRTGFEGFEPLRSIPNLDFSDPNLRFLDVTGDGRADIVVFAGDLILLYRTKGRAGFESVVRRPLPKDEREGPRVLFSDARSAVLTADMTGDGLSDIVRVENSRITYWPNLGHGRFGAMVTMGSAPMLDRATRFDGRRVRLADLEGPGQPTSSTLAPTASASP